MAETVSFEQFHEVKQVVDALVPGYYRRAVDPFEALENQQGNCFTNAVVGAMACSEMFGVEASMAWSSRLHATPYAASGIGGARSSSGSRDQVPGLNISHIELVVPRGIDEYDVLSLGYGLNVQDGEAFEKEDQGGVISNYNFPGKSPERVDVEGLAVKDEPMLVIEDGGEIIPTRFGVSLELVSMDWQAAADEYRAALDLPPLDFDKLREMFQAKSEALSGWKEVVSNDSAPTLSDKSGFSAWCHIYSHI